MTCLHQTLSKVVHCWTPRWTSLSLGPAQSERGPLPIANVGPSRADYPRSTQRTKKKKRGASAGDERSQSREHEREEVASLPLSSQPEGGGCEPPSSLLEPVPMGGCYPYTPPLIPIMPFPHLACQNTDGWDRGQAGRTIHLTHCGSSHAEWPMGEAALRAESGPRNP